MKNCEYAFLFPGQGSQSIGMGRFLFDEFKLAKHIFEEASEAIKLDLKKLCFESDEKILALTENTQPALLTVSTATAQVLIKEFGITPSITAGHSIGEYASLVLAEVMSFSDAVKAVRFRGEAMQSAVPVGLGGMLAVIGLTNEQCQYLCRWAESASNFKPLSCANFNCDGQVVLSGNLKAIEWLQANFKAEILTEAGLGEAKRAKLIPLQVSAPFHCQMMKPAEDRMRLFLNDIKFQPAKIPVVQNINAKVVTESEILKENLTLQVSGSVLWSQSMKLLKDLNKSQIIECGNGSVIKGLLKKIDADFFNVYSTNNLDDLKAIETA